ncbi:MAG TPA: hypothetical protein VG318_08860 [Actinomycetota bacterium]|nr:hypothetical protein [Actinomycetota bacterium]
MTEGPEVSVLVHELGGMLSSVQGFAHIAEANPEHPDRERFIKLAASEARRAAQALKDLHLARALDRGGISAAPPPVALSELMARIVNEMATTGLHLTGAPGVMVRVDPAKAAGLLARCLGASRVPAEVRKAGGDAELVLVLGPAGELDRKRQALDAPYPDMVLFSLTRRLLEHWGGGLRLAAAGDVTTAVIRLAGA